MLIVLGIAFGFFILVLVLADKFTPMSNMLSSFKKGTYEKLLIGLSIASILLISLGIYFKLTYQPPFLDVTVEDKNYTIFGDIGEFGYFADSLIYQNIETNIWLVSWHELTNNQIQLLLEYPSGKEEIWEPQITKVDTTLLQIPNYDQSKITGLYQLSSFSFNEEGNIRVSILKQEKIVGDFILKVKSDD
ncbi:hypothetical protein HNQ94_001624 [Salirhabdus euzebyi]|uniref:Uncharacterized protein n=1 Tax=Salirhabdus euzebyi TaxID=394506 RepID=A0A841Q442_9BACI|nr:hypothetical protein [Salirhabdus euzebyi]MBB6453176.1 hypothetical protein [Salirhabdus euzebyi]